MLTLSFAGFTPLARGGITRLGPRRKCTLSWRFGPMPHSAAILLASVATSSDEGPEGEEAEHGDAAYREPTIHR